MTEQAVSGPEDERAALILAKVHVIRNLVDGARWGLLDVMVELGELEPAIKQLVSSAAAPTVGSTAIDVNVLAGEPDHTDYVPEGNGDRSC